jgi:hypothetical protein
MLKVIEAGDRSFDSHEALKGVPDSIKVVRVIGYKKEYVLVRFGSYPSCMAWLTGMPTLGPVVLRYHNDNLRPYSVKVHHKIVQWVVVYGTLEEVLKLFPKWLSSKFPNQVTPPGWR